MDKLIMAAIAIIALPNPTTAEAQAIAEAHNVNYNEAIEVAAQMYDAKAMAVKDMNA